MQNMWYVMWCVYICVYVLYIYIYGIRSIIYICPKLHVWILSVYSWTMMEYWKRWSPKIIYLFNFGAHIFILRSPKVALLPCQDLFGNSSKPTLPHKQQMIWVACTPLHLLFSCFCACFSKKGLLSKSFCHIFFICPTPYPTPGYLLCLVTCLLPLDVRLLCLDHILHKCSFLPCSTLPRHCRSFASSKPFSSI